MSDQTEDFEMAWQRLEYATEEHAKILVINADLCKRIAELEQTGQATLLREIEKDKRIAELETENERLRGVVDRIQGWMEEGHHINLTKQWFDDALRKIDAAMEGN